MLAVVGRVTKTATLILMLGAGVTLLLGVTATSGKMKRLVVGTQAGSHGY
jgi:hypothetical protein